MLAPRNLIAPTILSIGAWSLECMSLWTILRGFGETTSVTLCVFFYATSTLAGALVPVPGGLGVTESALQGQMTELGHVSASTSAAAMILVRFATLWFAVLVGFVSLSLLKRRHPGLLAGGEQVRGEPHAAQGGEEQSSRPSARSASSAATKSAGGGGLEASPRSPLVG